MKITMTYDLSGEDAFYEEQAALRAMKSVDLVLALHDILGDLCSYDDDEKSSKFWLDKLNAILDRRDINIHNLIS